MITSNITFKPSCTGFVFPQVLSSFLEELGLNAKDGDIPTPTDVSISLCKLTVNMSQTSGRMLIFSAELVKLLVPFVE